MKRTNVRLLRRRCLANSTGQRQFKGIAWARIDAAGRNRERDVACSLPEIPSGPKGPIAIIRRSCSDSAADGEVSGRDRLGKSVQRHRGLACGQRPDRMSACWGYAPGSANLSDRCRIDVTAPVAHLERAVLVRRMCRMTWTAETPRPCLKYRHHCLHLADELVE